MYIFILLGNGSTSFLFAISVSQPKFARAIFDRIVEIGDQCNFFVCVGCRVSLRLKVRILRAMLSAEIFLALLSGRNCVVVRPIEQCNMI